MLPALEDVERQLQEAPAAAGVPGEPQAPTARPGSAGTSHKERQEAAGEMLGKPIAEADIVFTRADGSPMKPGSVTHAFKWLVRKLSLKGVRLHDLRHTHASLMLAQGVHPKIVSERLGHSTVSITLDTYSHVAPGLQEAAAKSFEASLVAEKSAVAGG